MNAKVREFGVVFCVSLLAIIALLLPVRETNAQQPSENQGREERVRDTSRTIDVEGVGSVEVFESVNTPADRHYIAPVFDFVLIEPSVIAKFSDTDEAIKMKIKMVPRDVRREVAESLSSLTGRKILVQNVGNLRLYAVFVDVDSQTTKNNFEVKEFRIENPVSTQGLDVSLDVKKEKGKDLAAAINRGEITFRLSYAYNSINLDSRREELRVRTVLDSSSYRRLEQQGQELMTADQMAEAVENMKREITSEVYLGLGKIVINPTADTFFHTCRFGFGRNFIRNLRQLCTPAPYNTADHSSQRIQVPGCIPLRLNRISFIQCISDFTISCIVVSHGNPLFLYFYLKDYH